MASGGFLWFTGDLLCQHLVNSAGWIEKKDSKEIHSNMESNPIDWKRVGNMVFYGTFLAAPIYTFWYSFLDNTSHKIFSSLPSKDQPQPAKPHLSRIYRIISFKIIADILLFDPLYLSFFFVTTNALERNSWNHTKEKIKKEFQMTYFIDILVWLPIQLFNFRYIPVSYQALIVQSCNIGWNAFLSFVQHRHQP